jgi:uncharacterized protein YjiS (DUF1127 family)
MDLRNTHPEPRSRLTFDPPSPEELRRLMASGRQLQAEAVRDTVASAWRQGARLIRAATEGIRRRAKRHATRMALESCSDRTLADIGIRREHIALVAAGLDPRRHVPTDPSPAGRWQAARAWLGESAARRKRQTQIYRELMLYSDEELNELGVNRRDVPRIARAA